MNSIEVMARRLAASAMCGTLLIVPLARAAAESHDVPANGCHTETLAGKFDKIAPSPLDTELTRRLKRVLDSLTAAARFSGAVLLARNDVPVFSCAAGFADREHSIANTVETSFNLASVGKLFTQTAVEQLETAGKLAPTSTIATYWPDYPNADVARKVTINQLVTMSSGIGGDIFGTPETAHSIRTISDYLNQFVQAPLEFEPGTKRAYSNSGYVVLGGIVERVSGEDYIAYLNRHIFTPAGMTRTGLFDRDSLPSYAAIGYTAGFDENAPGPIASNTSGLPGRGSPAGGGYSTLGDLLRYVHGIRSGAIAGTKGKPAGWAGGSPGANTFLVPDLPGGYTLIVLANFDPPVARTIKDAVDGWLKELRPAGAPTP